MSSLIIEVSRQRQGLPRTGACRQDKRRVPHLGEVEIGHQVVGCGVPMLERGQAEVLLGEAQHAGELQLGVIHARLRRVGGGVCVGRDHQERDAKAQSQGILLRWGDMVVEAAVVVPGEEDRRGGPLWAVLDGIELCDRPILPHAGGGRRVFTVDCGGGHPTYRGQVPGRRVGRQLLPGVNVLCPQAGVADIAEVVGGRPDVAFLALDGAVEAPGDASRRQFIGQRGERKAREHLALVVQLGGCGRRGVASPTPYATLLDPTRRVADLRVRDIGAGCSGQRKEVGGGRWPQQGRVGVVVEHEVLGQRPVVGDRGGRGRHVAGVGRRRAALGRQVEGIHLSLVVGLVGIAPLMLHIGRTIRQRGQGDGGIHPVDLGDARAGSVHAGQPIGAQVRPKVAVKRAVLLHNKDDMLDRRLRQTLVGARGGGQPRKRGSEQRGSEQRGQDHRRYEHQLLTPSLNLSVHVPLLSFHVDLFPSAPGRHPLSLHFLSMFLMSQIIARASSFLQGISIVLTAEMSLIRFVLLLLFLIVVVFCHNIAPILWL